MEDLIGIDTNILVYALDPTCPEHNEAKKTFLLSEGWAVNSTVVHECYHTLVFKRKISPVDSRLKIVGILKDPRTTFLNLTRSVSLLALDLATKMNLGGRDSLILGSYLHKHIPEIYSHDEELVELGKVSLSGRRIRIYRPCDVLPRLKIVGFSLQVMQLIPLNWRFDEMGMFAFAVAAVGFFVWQYKTGMRSR